jgi:drug/metabolite transporter (DMT)-like permease
LRHGHLQEFDEKPLKVKALRKNQLNSNAEAMLWVVLGTALFSLIFASGKFGGETMSVLQIQFLRYLSGFAALLCVVACKVESLRAYRSVRPFSHAMRAAFGVSGGFALIYSSAAMPIVDATALGLLYVVFIIPLAVLVLKETVTKQHMVGITLSFAGAGFIMISRGAFTQFEPAYLVPAAIAILGAALLAIEGLMIRVLSHADKPLTVLLYVNGFGILFLAVPAIMTWKAAPLSAMAPFLLLGPIAVAAQYCVVRGYRLASLAIVGPVDYAWLVFAALIGFLFFNEIPTTGVIAGAAIIAIGGVVLAIIKPEPEAARAEDL